MQGYNDIWRGLSGMEIALSFDLVVTTSSSNSGISSMNSSYSCSSRSCNYFLSNVVGKLI